MNILEGYELEKIWDQSKGPFSEVINGKLQRTKAGMKALQEELAYYLSRMPLESPTEAAGEFSGGESWGSSSNE